MPIGSPNCVHQKYHLSLVNLSLCPCPVSRPSAHLISFVRSFFKKILILATKISVFPVVFCAPEPVYPTIIEASYNSNRSNQPNRIFFVAQIEVRSSLFANIRVINIIQILNEPTHSAKDSDILTLSIFTSMSAAFRIRECPFPIAQHSNPYR